MALLPLRLARRVPPFAWLVIGVLAALPWYMAYFAVVLQRFAGVELWIQREMTP